MGYRKENLRICSVTQNNGNSLKTKGLSSKYKGVTFNKKSGKWVAQISIENNNKYLGLHPTEKDAAEAYNKAAIDYFGKFALLNQLN